MNPVMKDTYLAIDFGGGSGRVIAGSIAEGKLELVEIHRFNNRQIPTINSAIIIMIANGSAKSLSHCMSYAMK